MPCRAGGRRGSGPGPSSHTWGDQDDGHYLSGAVLLDSRLFNAEPRPQGIEELQPQRIRLKVKLADSKTTTPARYFRGASGRRGGGRSREEHNGGDRDDNRGGN